MKAVLISIQPKWCEKIASGRKTLELRKTRPKIEAPFKCYIYMTAGNASYPVMKNGTPYMCHNNGGKVVIGEFVCDRIFPIRVFNNGAIQNWNFYSMKDSCIPYDDISMYIGNNRSGYGWNISDLKIYDKPKELSEFYCACKFKQEDGTCPTKLVACSYQQIDYNPDGSINLVECGKRIERPPQSWCYVEVCDD